MNSKWTGKNDWLFISLNDLAVLQVNSLFLFRRGTWSRELEKLGDQGKIRIFVQGN